MQVYFDKTNKYHQVKGKTILEILKELKILPNTVVISVNNEIVLETKKISSKDSIKILSVVSGG